MSSKALLLGYKPNEFGIADRLEDLGLAVSFSDQVVSSLSEYDLVVSFGYRFLISPQTLQSAQCPVINLHTSFLPHNRGAHPIFWACLMGERTGVTIHELDSGLDTGNIYVQRAVPLPVEEITFREAYALMLGEMEDLFQDSVEQIVSERIAGTKQSFVTPSKKTSDLPKEFRGWDTTIGPETRRLREVLGLTAA